MQTYKRAVVSITDIVWDEEFEGEKAPDNLPKEMKVEVDIPTPECDHDDSIKDIAIDIASDYHGFCIKESCVNIQYKYTP